MHRAGRQQHRHGDGGVVDLAVAQDEEMAAVVYGLFGLPADAVDSGFEPGHAVVERPGRRHRAEPGFGRFVRAQGGEFVLEQDR